MAADRPIPYKVEFAGHSREQLRRLLISAAASGRRAEVTAEAESLHRALTWVPELVAERCYWMPPLGWVHAGSHRSIQLRFAVNDELRTVVIAYFRLNPPESE